MSVPESKRQRPSLLDITPLKLKVGTWGKTTIVNSLCFIFLNSRTKVENPSQYLQAYKSD